MGIGCRGQELGSTKWCLAKKMMLIMVIIMIVEKWFDTPVCPVRWLERFGASGMLQKTCAMHQGATIRAFQPHD